MGDVGLLGANSLVGNCAIQRLSKDGCHIVAFSRCLPDDANELGVTWLQLPVMAHHKVPPVKSWLCVAPIWVLPQYFDLIGSGGPCRVVALSSTSLFVKHDSTNPVERETARRLEEGECALRLWAETHGVEWVVLRPTLIYGHGRDKNVTEIIRFVRRWGFFPLLGKGNGLRQPVYAEDVATACVSALTVPVAANRTYNLSGGETLSYADMVCRVFESVGKVPHLVAIPPWLFRLAVTNMRLFQRYKHWTVEMAERMNRDLVFDHADAARDLGFSPRLFQLAPEDFPT